MQAFGLSLFAALFHDAEEIAFGVFDPHEPQIMVGHVRDDLRFLMDRNVFGFCVGQEAGHVGRSEIEERVAGGMLRALSGGKVEADAATIEERHVWGGHEDGQAERVAIERGRAIDFFHGDGDLEDSGQ